MKYSLLILLIAQAVMTQTFKEQQLKFPRVRSAFNEKQEKVQQLLTAVKVDPKSFTIFLRAYKSEQRLEVWAKNRLEKKHVLVTSYPFCASSGVPGPKRQEGDGQIPEGIYHIRHFNPVSSFHLSLGINYPNASDAVLGVKGKLGGEIYIHGDCVTVGCIPITDDLIKELYVFAVEACSGGQEEIPVHIYPFMMNDDAVHSIEQWNDAAPDVKLFWNNLIPIHRAFESTKELSPVTIDRSGLYHLQ
ncbi:MAG: L,D-transpeptidase family protein [Bacteroidetes bacterium]|nr:L,D-transpeptidase family protein [Bacteroidota bacterium]